MDRAPLVKLEDRITGTFVSHWSGDIDFDKLDTDRVRFMFIKFTEATGFIDNCGMHNAQGCKDIGLPFGGLHFFHPHLSPYRQVQHFIANSELGWLPDVLDFEKTFNMDPVDLNSRVIDFLRLAREYGRERWLLYSNTWLFNWAIKDWDTVLSMCELWYALPWFKLDVHQLESIDAQKAVRVTQWLQPWPVSGFRTPTSRENFWGGEKEFLKWSLLGLHPQKFVHMPEQGRWNIVSDYLIEQGVLTPEGYPIVEDK